MKINCVVFLNIQLLPLAVQITIFLYFSRCPNPEGFAPSSVSGHLVHHFATVHCFSESGSQCNLCKTIFNSINELKSHIAECHSNEYQKFRCDFCNFGTNKKENLKNHNISKHSQVPHFPCKHCSRDCFTQADLEFHVKQTHAKKSTILSCPRCNKSFQHLQRLCQHLQNEHKENEELGHEDGNDLEDKKEFISRYVGCLPMHSLEK